MKSKIVKGLAYSVIILAFLSVYGALVKHPHKLGIFEKPVIQLTKFPETLRTIYWEMKGKKPTYVFKDESFIEKNTVDYDVFGLNSFFISKDKKWEIRLFNFKTDSVLYTWHVDKSDFYFTYKQFSNAEPRSTILLEDKSIIVLFAESNNVLRLDSLSNIVWKNNETYFHHTMNLGIDSNIWVCTSEYQALHRGYYVDDYLTKLDLHTGQIIYHKSLSRILLDNNQDRLLFGYTNYGQNSTDYGYDPLHLNDIEIAVNTSKFWEKGDLFLSLRHRSAIIHFRPHNHTIVQVLYGPFCNQHDVDILSDSTIAIFNNNIATFGTKQIKSNMIQKTNDRKIDVPRTSNIVIYDFETKKYNLHLNDQFIEENICTLTQGLQHFMSNGDVYVESQNNGKLYIMNESEIKLKKYLKTPVEGMVRQPHWIRIYEDISFLNE